MSFGRAYNRIRGLDPVIGDRLLAGLLMVGSAVESIAYADGDPMVLVLSALGLPALGAVAWRRTHPLIAALAICLVFVPIAAIYPDFFNQTTAPFLGLMVVLYSIGRYEWSRWAGPAVAMLLGALTVGTVVSPSYEGPTQLIWLLLLGAGPFLAGRALGNRTRLQQELRERTEQLERDREIRARRAVEEERSRIASELQAVVANGVSAMVLQAEAVPRLIAAGDGARAERTFALIEETGRDSLAEMRRLLGVLRRDAELPLLAPQPTMAEVERLAERARAAGLEVGIAFEGAREELPAGADLAAYRIVQEALGAAAGDGASSADVVLGYGGDELRIEVSDDRPGDSGNREPIVAMRERLALYGGRLRAGTSATGYRIDARLPLNGGPR